MKLVTVVASGEVNWEAEGQGRRKATFLLCTFFPF